jgi:D-glycero-D-manno-heptose 1,7-bisphosphate phosphatase
MERVMRDVDYCGDPVRVDVFPDAADALRRLKANGYKLNIVTNQSGIARGHFSENDYRAVEKEFLRQLLGEGLIDTTYCCPDPPDPNSPRRKPAPGMILEAQRDHRLDLARSYFIGDKTSDMGCGRNAGVRTILVQMGYGAREIDCRLIGSRAISTMRWRSSSELTDEEERCHPEPRSLLRAKAFRRRCDEEGPRNLQVASPSNGRRPPQVRGPSLRSE